MTELLKELIRARSTAETGEYEAAQVIQNAFRAAHIETSIDRWGGNRANITARVKSAGKKPGLLLACHIDVVGPGGAAWQYPPFEAIQCDGRVYGRGAADMKGGTAAAIQAICDVAAGDAALQGDIVFAAVAGEETDSCGAERFINNYGWPTAPAGVVIPEPTDFDIVTAHRGMLWLRVITKGKAAHGSAPHLGINAIQSMKAVLDELEGYRIECEPHPLLGGCSMSVNTIAGGKTMNVVPDGCTMGIDMRILPGQKNDAIIADFERILDRCRRADREFEGEIEVVRHVPAMETDPDSDFVQQFCNAVDIGHTKAVGFTTDGPFFAALGAPVLIFGPGKGELCHKPDEYIDIVDLDRAVEYYKAIIRHFLM